MTTGRINQISIGAWPRALSSFFLPPGEEEEEKEGRGRVRLTIFVDRLCFFFFFVMVQQKKKKEKDNFFRKKKFLFIFNWLLTSFTGWKKSYSRYCCKLRPVFFQPKLQLQFRESANSFLFFFFFEEKKKIENTAAHKGVAKEKEK